jgi:DNA-binding NtrC family response regulator
MQKLLLVEDDPALQFTIQTFLEANGYEVDAVSTTDDAADRINEYSYPIVVSDIYIDQRTGLFVLEAAKSKDARSAVIIMSGRGTIETAVAATRGGAFDYIAKPFELDALLEVIKRAEAVRNDTEKPAEEEELPESEMIGSSAAMVEVYKRVSRVAPTDATVIIEGETGTGKEMVARMIHRYSLRVKQPFVVVDCTAIAPARRLRPRCWRASCSARCAARIPAPIAIAWVFSKRPTAERFSWTRSARSIRAFRRACCGFCRSTRFARWGRRAPRKSTSA